MKDLAKRRRVMGRSIRLGHCICDPKKSCPCDLFKERDVCLCAGERLEATSGPVRLTRLVENAGCASKIDQAALKQVLSGLSFPEDPRVLVGVPAGDDAGVFRVDEHTVLVQTVDVFSPSVDDAYTFGTIAAANSLSDVYAMGARPLTALSIIGFPIRTVPESVMRDILRGGIDKMAEAGVAVIGGHSIKDQEIKAGFAVTGVVDPARMVTNAGARAGDVLVLTKPLGTGILAFAAQIERARPEWTEASARSMATLNRTASELMLRFGAHAATDVTGFGLAGHLGEMARASSVDVEIVWDDLPLLPGVLECVAVGIIPGSVERNRESSGDRIVPGDGITPAMVEVCLDAQTSGGLLIAVAPERADALLKALHRQGSGDSVVIGRMTGKGAGRIHLVTRGRRPLATNEAPLPPTVPEKACCVTTEGRSECCAQAQKEACCSEPAKDECCAGGHAAPRGVANEPKRRKRRNRR